MAFDLIPRQMVAFHGEGILQTKHFHDDDIEGGNVHYGTVRLCGAHFLGGGQTRKLMTSASTRRTEASNGDIIGIGAEAKSIDRDLSVSLPPFLHFFAPLIRQSR